MRVKRVATMLFEGMLFSFEHAVTECLAALWVA